MEKSNKTLRVADAVLVGLFLTQSAFAQEPGGHGAIPANRVVVHLQNGVFQLLACIPLIKSLPDSDATIDGEQLRSGFWYELQASDGSVRYRRAVANPLIDRVEMYDPASDGLVLVEQIAQDKLFSVLIPRAETDNLLVLFSSPLQRSSLEPAKEISRIDLDIKLTTPTAMDKAPGHL
jgi:hypothetical protein